APLGRLEKAEIMLGAFTQRLFRFMPQQFEQKERALATALQNLRVAMLQKLDKQGKQLENFDLRLQGLDPVLPLRRGYAFINKADGSLLRSSKEARPGEYLELRMVDGVVPVVVTIKDLNL
ncbi:MAG: hypothetical protein LBV76_04835, partial [Deltaproteobacteria bacterium]|nr:hypothetical protein [Deltaproteobacteria bacterium]